MKASTIVLVSALLLGAGTIRGYETSSFINFETASVHPVGLSPAGSTLAVCNLPAGRLQFYDLSSGVVTSLGEVPVGIDPVSVRFRTTNEAWVINHISASISIVAVARRHVIATLQTRAGPADIVFAGSPQRAFVSCSRENVSSLTVTNGKNVDARV